MSCKGRASWQEQRGLCSCVKAARDGGDQEPWGPFCPNPATYLPSPLPEKRISLFTARKMEQNSFLRTFYSLPHPFPPSLLDGVERSKVPRPPQSLALGHAVGRQR